MVGVFISLDLMLYYGFWELSLVPMAILIAMYGRKRRPRSGNQVLPLHLHPICAAPCRHPLALRPHRHLQLHRTPTPHRQRLPARRSRSSGLHLAFLFAFAVKVPVFPLHGWLADTFSEAPVAMAMVVAGKLGLYSMLRFHVELIPRPGPRHRAHHYRPRGHRHPLWCMSRPGSARFLASPCLCRSESSEPHHSRHLRHSLSPAGRRDLSDPESTNLIDAALFVLLGALEIRYATSQIAAFGGLANKVPRLATFFVIVSLAMIGLPMLNGFVGEFLILSSTFTGVSRGAAIAATLSVILGAAYMLWLMQRLFYGTESNLATSVPLKRPAPRRVNWSCGHWPC